MSIGFYNGNFNEIADIRIPLTDRCVFFGDGIYDAAIGINEKIHLKDEHLERFLQNAKKTDIPCPYSENELSALLDEAVKKSGEDCFFLYFQLTRSSAERKHAYTLDAKSNLLITVTPTPLPNPARRLKLVTYEDRRYYYCDIKTLNLLPSVLASGYAESLGADEAVFHRKNTVTECAHSNISIIKNGVLYTHPTGRLILPGIARKTLLQKCAELSIPVSTSAFTIEALYSADEVLITSSTKLCQLADSVGSKKYEKSENSPGQRLANAVYEDFILATT